MKRFSFKSNQIKKYSYFSLSLSFSWDRPRLRHDLGKKKCIKLTFSCLCSMLKKQILNSILDLKNLFSF